MASVTSGAESQVWPDRAIHPGIYLGEEIQAHGLTQTELARRMERPVQVINEVVRGRKAISEETALGLERVLGTPARVWLNLQSMYGLARARLQEEAALEEQAGGWTASRSRRWHSATGSNREIRSPIRFGPSSSSSGCNPSPTGMSGMRRSASVSPQRQRRIGSLSIRGCDGARSRVSTCPPSRTTKHVSGMHCWRFAD